VRQSPSPPHGHLWSRGILTLAIETSCDDTSVAVLERHDDELHCPGPRATLHFHEKITSNNAKFGGIHPLVAIQSHQENLALLVSKAIESLPDAPEQPRAGEAVTVQQHGRWISKKRPDFVAVTRGPGMRSSLQTGLDTAKGLAAAWQVPIVGVHHMQAHALTPRLVSALELTSCCGSSGENEASRNADIAPNFPFLSLLVSGGHTLLIHSASLAEHRILASTTDTAVGDCLDKVARAVLPAEVLSSCKDTMYGAALEQYAFPGAAAYSENDATFEQFQEESYSSYIPPKTHAEELKKRISQYGWGLKPPLAESPRSLKARSLEFSFAGLATAAERIATFATEPDGKLSSDLRRADQEQSFPEAERRELARETMRVAFEHLAGRTMLALETLTGDNLARVDALNTLVVSGGVAANNYLRYM
jgi:N6-L-threonylcarbamoyladenine synthase